MAAKIVRPCSVRVSHEGVAIEEVVDGIWDFLGRPQRIFNAVQTINKNVTDIQFCKNEQATQICQQQSVILNDRTVSFERAGRNVKHVFVKLLPPELNDTFIATRFVPFGQVLSIKREFKKIGRWQVESGTRIVAIDMSKPVPNFMKFGGYEGMCVYRGVERTCKKCKNTGHLAFECKKFVCENCGSADHLIEKCKKSCGKCYSYEHLKPECPEKTWAERVNGGRGSGSVVQEEQPEAQYDEALEEDEGVGTIYLPEAQNNAASFEEDGITQQYEQSEAQSEAKELPNPPEVSTTLPSTEEGVKEQLAAAEVSTTLPSTEEGVKEHLATVEPPTTLPSEEEGGKEHLAAADFSAALPSVEEGVIGKIAAATKKSNAKAQLKKTVKPTPSKGKTGSQRKKPSPKRRAPLKKVLSVPSVTSVTSGDEELSQIVKYAMQTAGKDISDFSDF